MKLAIKCFIGTLILIILCGVGFILLSKYYTTPTNGEKIATYGEKTSALLVIDIQDGLTGKTAKTPYPYKNSEVFIDNVNNIIDIAKKKDYLIIYIRQEFENKFLSQLISGGRLFKGQPGTKFDARLKLESQNVFTKKKSDAFSNVELEKLLIKNQVNQLYVVGIDADVCVYNTSKGAINRNYKVSVIKDGIITMNMGKMNAILEKYKKDNISIIDSSDFKK